MHGCGLGTLHVATECTLDTDNSVFWILILLVYPGYYLLSVLETLILVSVLGQNLDTRFGVRAGDTIFLQCKLLGVI